MLGAMRRLSTLLVALSALLLAAAPAPASAGTGGGGWVPAPSAPFDMPAGARSAVVDYRPGGTLITNSTWYLAGPAMFGFREGGGDHPRGLWVFDGLYKIDFGPTSYKTVTIYHGTGHDVCTDLD